MVKVKVFIGDIEIQYWLDIQTLCDVSKAETKYKKYPIKHSKINK